MNQATEHSTTSASLSLTLSCGLIGWLLLIFLNVSIGVLWGPTFGSFLFPVFSYSFDFLYGFQILSHITYNLPICIFSHNSPNAPRIESLTSRFISPRRVQGSQAQHFQLFVSYHSAPGQVIILELNGNIAQHLSLAYFYP